MATDTSITKPLVTNDTDMVIRSFYFGDIDCFSPLMTITNGIWLGDNPLKYTLPLLFIQLLLINVLTRILHSILRPLRQPVFISEILAGLVLRQTILGRAINPVNIFPARSIHILSSAGHFGLLLFAFMVGVELDVKLLRQMGQKITVIGIACILVPFLVTTCAAYQFRHLFPEDATDKLFYVYLGIAFSITPFPIVARVLSDLKLLNSELGHLSVAASMVTEMFTWVLVSFEIYFRVVIKPGEYDTSSAAMPMGYIVPSLVVFVFVCMSVVRPAVVWLLRMTPNGERMSDVHAGIILMGVPLAGIIADSFSVHFVLGAFVYGLVVPSEPHGTQLIERMDALVVGFLMPVYFSASGFLMNFDTVKDSKHVILLVCTFLLACTIKVLVTTLLALYYNMPFHESLSLGFLMNVKGFIVLTLMGISKNAKVLNPETTTVLLISAATVTAMVVPVVVANYKPSRARAGGHQRRNLILARLGQQLCVLACVHNGRSVPSTIALLDLSNPTKRSPISIYALHLVEQTGRASAMLITHNSINDRKRNHHFPRHQAQSEHIVSSFEAYEQHAGGVSLQVLTSISPYSAMHEDICHVAEDKQADIIILPFHKLQTVDGNMEAPQPAIRAVNQKVLSRAPCSVAIFIDRFLGKKDGRGTKHKVALLFFGGPDDREALACAWRMADHPSVSLTVVGFVSGGVAGDPKEEEEEEEEERALDEQYVSEFRLQHLSCETIEYTESVVNNAEETVEALRSISSSRLHDLYIVGRSQGKGASKLTAGLTEWSECPELGPVGDLLASADFGTTASVMVVQQYVSAKEAREMEPRLERHATGH